MAFNSNGEVQYLVLSSLENGSKYGLEIIEFISNVTGGNYILKKPTLYSCLTRMEKKGLVSSSFWGESDMGGKRHYYSITPAGKQNLAELKAEFQNVDPKSFGQEEMAESTKKTDEKANNETQTVVLQQDNLFNLVKENKPEQKQEEKKEETIENQIDFFSYSSNTSEQPNQPAPLQDSTETQQKIEYYMNVLEQTPTQEPVKDDGKLLETDESLLQEEKEQNKRLYDTASEFNKYRKRKSFAENQIEMNVVYETEDDQAIQRERLAALKASLNEMKANSFTSQAPNENNTSSTETAEKQEENKNYSIRDLFYKREESPVNAYETNQSEQNTETEEPVVDDAKFITERVDIVPVQRKIAPPDLDVDVSDVNLPAPKRDTRLEPTYKDMMAKLFENKKEKQIEKQPEKIFSNPNVASVEENTAATTFGDYNSLQKYYAHHGIAFREYKQTNVERHHNTNFLVFISSAILLFLSGIGCAVLFGIFAGAKVLSVSSNFLFYVVPILFLLYALYCLLKHKLFPSKKASLLYSALINWSIFALACVIIVVANVISGMQVETFAKYATSIFVPIFAAFLALPVNFYIKKFLFKKYAK